MMSNPPHAYAGVSSTVDVSVEGRQSASRLVRWCPEGKTWQPADEPVCLWTHNDDGSHHRLRLRRMLICSDKECQQVYFTQEEFDDHICGSAY